MSLARSLVIIPLAAAAALAGCAKGPAPISVPLPAAPLVAPLAPVAVAPVAAVTLPVAARPGALKAGSHVVDRGAAVFSAAEAAPTAAELAADSAPGEDDPPLFISAYMAAAEPPSYNVDDRIPYGVVVAERSAHTATIAWRTEVPTRGIIEYGRSWGFDKNGYTHQFVDDVPKTDHMIALTDLRRWTGYTYKITAVTALGLKFPEQERKFRTKFWSWR